MAWLDEVPAHWSESSLRWLSSRYTGGTPDRDNPEFWQDGSIPWLNSGAVNEPVIREPSAYISEAGFAGSSAKWIPEGALVMALAGQGKTKGTVAQLGFSATCNQSMAALIPTKRVNARYLFWWLRSNYANIRSMSGGDLRDGLNLQLLGDITVPLPSQDEQQTIASFLDSETAQIDDLIGKQEQLIELLAEKRQAIITHAVTKGLDPTAPTKPSGVPWQGSVPEHWSVQPLKNMMRMQTGVTLGKDFAQDVTETYAYLRVANVQIGYVDLTDVKEIDLPPEVAASSILQPGDVLMTEGGDRDKLARGCIWDGSINPCVHQNHIFAVRTGPQLLSSFLVLLLDADPARTYFYLTGKQSTNLASTNSTTVKNFRFGVPPISEQLRIVDHLKTKTLQIDELTEKAKAVISTLKERRSALISAAVTGKIDLESEAELYEPLVLPDGPDSIIGR